MKRLSKEAKSTELHPEVRAIWYSKTKEPETQEFRKLPDWMLPSSDMDHMDLIDLKRIVNDKLSSLTPKEHQALVMRFWHEMTLEEVGKAFNVTRERLRQIEAKALRKLSHPSRSDYLAPYIDIVPHKSKWRRKQFLEAVEKLNQQYENYRREKDATEITS